MKPTEADVAKAREFFGVDVTNQTPITVLEVNNLAYLLAQAHANGLEEAARIVETRGTNNVGMVHPIDAKLAEAIRKAGSAT